MKAYLSDIMSLEMFGECIAGGLCALGARFGTPFE